MEDPIAINLRISHQDPYLPSLAEQTNLDLLRHRANIGKGLRDERLKGVMGHSF